ncbi:MAG: hypothetical protein LBS60_09060 [Deltaproteobacteria bacterium]|jgi:hypothetical protein|nr:hypothetical protein [Deltaproteobacteria bacterium]
MEFLIDGRHGIYVPQEFAEAYGEHISDPEDKAILLAGPDHDQYWDTWAAIVDNVDIDGGFLLESDGLYLIFDEDIDENGEIIWE